MWTSSGFDSRHPDGDTMEIHMQTQVIVEIINDLVVSLWANEPIDFTITDNGYTVRGGSEVRIWYSADPEMPQYDPTAEGLTKYYPVE